MQIDYETIRRLRRHVFWLDPRQSIQGCSFYDISGRGMHHPSFGKPQVRLKRAAVGKVTAGTLIAFRRRADIMGAYKIIVLF
jgi:hypothetical protein